MRDRLRAISGEKRGETWWSFLEQPMRNELGKKAFKIRAELCQAPRKAMEACVPLSPQMAGGIAQGEHSTRLGSAARPWAFCPIYLEHSRWKGPCCVCTQLLTVNLPSSPYICLGWRTPSLLGLATLPSLKGQRWNLNHRGPAIRQRFCQVSLGIEHFSPIRCTQRAEPAAGLHFFYFLLHGL